MKIGLRIAVVFAIGAVSSTRAIAQAAAPANDPFAGVEEMVVTGSSTADLLNTTNNSTIAFDSADLANIGVEDVGDLEAYVPNLEIASVNATNASFFVRGVGLQDFGANASSSVPIFQDGIPRNPSATQLTGLFDTGGITVLKGPEGSGNFRNASAGAIVVTTNGPKEEFSGMARMSLSRIASVDSRDANRYQFETNINAPVVEDTVFARISARYSHENPFWENRCANRVPIASRPTGFSFCGEQAKLGLQSQIDPFIHRYLGEVDDYAIRGQIRIKPPDSGMDWTFRAEASNLNRDQTAGQAPGTGANIIGNGDNAGYRDRDLTNRDAQLRQVFRQQFPALPIDQVNRLALLRLSKEILKQPGDRHPYAGDLDTPGRTMLETHSVSTTGLIDLPDAQMTVNFGFIDYNKSEARDNDLTPNKKFPARGNDQAWMYYGDVAFKGDSIGDLPVSWDTGAYTLLEKVEAFNQQVVLDNSQETKFTQQIYSGGVYAEGSWEFLEAFELSGGIRYNWEQKDFKLRTDIINNVFGTEIRSEFGRSRNQRTWDSPTGFVNLGYEFTEDISAYVKYSRGFKAGHFNPSNARNARVPGEGFADPEQIDAVEWGVKSSLWASRANVSGTFFFYNYDNYQVFRLTTNFNGVQRVVQNAKQARNFGAELDITLKPLEGYVPEAIEGLSIEAHFGWLQAEFVEFSVIETRFLQDATIPVPIDYSGNPLLNAANLNASAIFSWPVVTDRFGTITPQYDFSWTDDQPYDPNRGRGSKGTNGEDKFPSYAVGQRAFILHNLRLSWTPPGDSGMTVAGWCRNILDRRYKTFAVDLSGFSSQQLWYLGDPRMCGADFRFTW